MFNFYNYFETLATTNKLATANDFHFCRTSGITGLEEAVNQMQKKIAFFCCDDVTDGSIICRNGNFFTRYIFTIFLLKRTDLNDMNHFADTMTVCRTLRTQIYKRILRDSEIIEELTYLDRSAVLFRELEKTALAGCTGTYFMFNVDIPTDLSYEENDYNE